MGKSEKNLAIDGVEPDHNSQRVREGIGRRWNWTATLLPVTVDALLALRKIDDHRY